jgi:hypothetical protein
LIRPAITALVVGLFGCSVAAFSLSFPHHLVGVVLGIVTAVAATVVGVVIERPLVIALGGLGFFMFDIRGFSIYLRSSSAAAGAGVLGLLIAVLGLSHAAQTLTRERRARASVQAEVGEEPVMTS